MSQYKNFTNSKNKIRKLWEKAEAIQNKLDLSENDYRKLYREKQNLKAPLLIFDTDWLAKNLANFAASSTEAKTLLPYTIDETFNEPIDFFCPPDYLPFIKINTQYKQIPGSEIYSFATYTRSQWNGNKVLVKADDDLIFYGIKPVGNPPQFTQAQLDAEQFQSNHAKKVFTMIIEWSDTGGQWRIRPTTASLTNSHISHIDVVYDRISSGLIRLFDSAIEYNYKELDMTRDAFATSLNTIYEITNTTLHLLGTYAEHTWAEVNDVSTTNFGGSIQLVPFDIISVNFVTVNGNPAGYTVTGNREITLDNPIGGGDALVIDYQSAQETVSSSNNTEVTITASQVYSYLISLTESILEKWNGSTYIQQGGITTHTVNSTTSGFTLINRSFSSGLIYNVYYDVDTRFIFGMDALGGLINPPFSLDTWPVSFTTITVKKNIDDAAPVSVDIDDIVSITDESSPSFILLEEHTTGVNKYRYYPNYSVVYLLPATVASMQNFEVWNDIYTIVGTAFSETTHSHTTTQLATYTAEQPDVELKTQLYINNPLNYLKETRARNE